MPKQVDPTPLTDDLWQKICQTAVSVGFDVTKFGDPHHQLVHEITTFLLNESAFPSKKTPPNGPFHWLSAPFIRKHPQATIPQPISPHIICGEPGTGKTTFLYILDILLRQSFNLPDNIHPIMTKNGRQQHLVAKRYFNGHPISLLSVKKWSELLHFYAWDVTQHRFDKNGRDQFIHNTLAPMRILFADEVEMTGYAPTLPNLAKAGILVVGTSNQYQFAQLIRGDISPTTYQFGGIDMRVGDPAQAVVTIDDGAWIRFEQLKNQPQHQFEQLTYHYQHHQDVLYILFDFEQAVTAPLLETRWITLLQTIYQQANPSHNDTTSQRPSILLFDSFSLAALQTDYNAIIRFVSLFDAIEQMGVGVLVRNIERPPRLSRQRLAHLKNTIQHAQGVPEEIRQKTVVGIARCASRIGQAAHHANHLGGWA